MTGGARRAKFERKSRGLDGKSKMFAVPWSARLRQPSDATIRVADEVRGMTPETLLMFAGQVTVSVQSSGSAKKYPGEGETMPLHLSIFNPSQQQEPRCQQDWK